MSVLCSILLCSCYMLQSCGGATCLKTQSIYSTLLIYILLLKLGALCSSIFWNAVEYIWRPGFFLAWSSKPQLLEHDNILDVDVFQCCLLKSGKKQHTSGGGEFFANGYVIKRDERALNFFKGNVRVRGNSSYMGKKHRTGVERIILV